MDNISHHKQNLEPWLFNCSCVGSMCMKYNTFPHHKEDPINCLLHGFMQFHICFLIYSSGNLDLYSVASSCNAWVLISLNSSMVLQLQLPFNVPFIQLHYCLSYILCLSCQVQLCGSHLLDVNLSNSCPKKCQRQIYCPYCKTFCGVCPCYKWTIKSCASAIVDLMTHHCFYLQLSSYNLECASLLPAEFSLPL